MSYFSATGGRGFALFITLLSSLVGVVPCHAYTLTQTQSGDNIRWRYGQKLFLAGNPKNQSGLSSDSVWQAVVNGLQQWSRASGGIFEFDYWQGTDPSIYSTRLDQDGLNSIFFASNSQEKTDPNVIGFTQVWFNTDNGNMMEADIILNDRDYLLTTNPSDTSSHSVAGEKTRVYLNNVVTHELGHAIGLSHSSSINSSMLYVEFSEQYKLGCDDWSATKHLYYNDQNRMGSLHGTILSPHGDPVGGAVVTAISINRGVPIASVHTEQNGEYDFGALEPGNYSMMVEKYDGSAASIPVRLRANRSAVVCDQNAFPKNFIAGDDQHSLQKFQVTAGGRNDIGAYRLRCDEVSDSLSTLATNTPDVLVDRGGVSPSKTYTFNANGPFQVTGLGYLLLSPIKISLSILDSSGNPVSTQGKSPIYQSDVSGFKIQDSQVSGVAFGPVTIKTEISPEEVSAFPIPAVSPGSSPYYVIVFNANAGSGITNALPNNPRCASAEPFSAYQSPPGNPIRNSTTTASRDSVGFCGNAEAASFKKGDGPHPRHPSSFGGILGWAFPFLAAIACQLCLRKRRAKLSA